MEVFILLFASIFCIFLHLYMWANYCKIHSFSIRANVPQDFDTAVVSGVFVAIALKTSSVLFFTLFVVTVDVYGYNGLTNYFAHLKWHDDYAIAIVNKMPSPAHEIEFFI